MSKTVKIKLTPVTLQVIEDILECIGQDIENYVDPSVISPSTGNPIPHVTSIRAFQQIIERDEYTEDIKVSMMLYHKLYNQRIIEKRNDSTNT